MGAVPGGRPATVAGAGQPPVEEASADRLMAQIQRNQALFDQIERLSLQWIEQMATPEFAAREARGQAGDAAAAHPCRAFR
ncbi:hypothetical protein NZK33_08870 [Cyanobium sp. FGCU-6]|nr:hypothetical protein [Cyanobium sp. FGCU6]